MLTKYKSTSNSTTLACTSDSKFGYMLSNYIIRTNTTLPLYVLLLRRAHVDINHILHVQYERRKCSSGIGQLNSLVNFVMISAKLLSPFQTRPKYISNTLANSCWIYLVCELLDSRCNF